MIFEIMPTGMIIPIYKVESVCAQPYFKLSDRIVSIYTLTLYTINIYYTYVEYKTIRIYGFMTSFRKKSTIVNIPRIIVRHATLLSRYLFQWLIKRSSWFIFRCAASYTSNARHSYTMRSIIATMRNTFRLTIDCLCIN